MQPATQFWDGNTSLPWVFDDGGRTAARFKGSAGDCVTRAVAIVSGRPYDEVYAALADGQGDQRKSKGRTARNGVNVTREWFKRYMRGLGFTWTPTMHIGSGCKGPFARGRTPGRAPHGCRQQALYGGPRRRYTRHVRPATPDDPCRGGRSTHVAPLRVRLLAARVSRIQFCGSIGGSVTIRKGETPEQALARAETTILALFERGAKNLSDDGLGPNVCLELADDPAEFDFASGHSE